MYVYRTSQFSDKAERYGVQPRIDDLCAELETQRVDQVQAHFERVYPYLKRRILNRRIIAHILRIDDQPVLCLLDIFKRGDKDYEQFLEAPLEYGRTHFEPQIDEQQVRGWLSQKTIEQPTTKKLPELPTNLLPWLEPPGWTMEMATEDWVIYESEEWVRRFREPAIQEAWDTYYQIILGIRTKTSPGSDFPDWSNVRLCEANNRYILYSEPNTADDTVGGVLFLLAPFEHEPSEEEISQVGYRTGLFDDSETTDILARQLSLSELTPFARRSYPAYLLADEESWLAIERGEEVNLALSTEEEQILQSVSASAPSHGSLPLFINGRAGSGKSTMLLYLFADYCHRKYYNKQGESRQKSLPGEPLFLTYNERLLEVARDGVNRLLSSHHRFVAQRNQREDVYTINHNFQPFSKFLLGLLPARERDRFVQSKYISFHRFKQLYQGHNFSDSLAKVVLRLPQKRRYSPETCWHVIRTFIKGYGLEDYMTPEDYQEEVPRKERTIDLEKFQGIYETIWERWYKRLTQEQGYWDDQDLIARVLKFKYYSPSFSAIFCDEAQDFTRLELQLIMRLSIFSQYHLGYQPIYNLPFAFAGDPLQTLNPTGFRWSNLQAAFDAEVVKALDPTEQLQLEINFQELAFNYRSSPQIVQVNNLIQLWRHVLFNIHELKPQTPWQRGNFPEPQKFIINQNITREDLKNYLRQTIIIVPCEEGEEAAYTKNDQVLSEIFSQNSDSEKNHQDTFVPKNILSAIAAKGLEFKKVILYKFGEECHQSVWNLKNQPTDQRVKIEYFFNKLYVAASRATERLFVVDSETGDRQLWQHASDEALLYAMRQHATNRELWEENVRTISLGIAKNAQDMCDDEPQLIATELEKKGLSSENPGLLRRARQFYLDIGEINQAGFCEAWILKIEGFFREAGNRFLDLGKLDEAWQCFWQGICWPELVDWYKENSETQLVNQANKTIGYQLAIFMVAESSNLEAISNFTSFILDNLPTSQSKTQLAQKACLDSIQFYAAAAPQEQWTTAIKEYGKRLEGLLEIREVKREEWQRFGQALNALSLAGYQGFNHLIAKCFYRAENYEQAVRIWEDCGNTKSKEYYRAKALILGLSQALKYWWHQGETQTILAEWEQAGKPRDRNWLEYVAPALEKQHQYQQAFVVYIWLDQLNKVKECFENACQGTPNIKILTVFLQYLYRHKYFGEAIEVIGKYFTKTIGSEHQKLDLKFYIINQLSGSELTPDTLTKEERLDHERFLKEQVFSNSNWRQYLSVQQVGITWEKLGSLTEALEFYEGFVASDEQELCQWSRERWLAVKKKQANSARKQGQVSQASKFYSELLAKAHIWSINQQYVTLDPPPVSHERPIHQNRKDSVKVSAGITSAVDQQSSRLNKPIIRGLPQGTKIEQLEYGVIRFGVRHLAIKVMIQAQQILITDVLSNREVRLDWSKFQVNLGNATVEAVGSKQLSFTVTTSGYSGKLIIGDKKHQLEIYIQGLSGKIQLEV
ncbi:hypothetical protein [Lyngbya aestuarii]|uniref:hypothetical protein n=1 Tax=Lyngbya aestuarii TaxID=118322 RepID=UPI00403E0423